MKKLKSFNQINEADIHDTLPEDYLRGIERKGEEQYGTSGPSMREMQEGMGIMQQIQRMQQGHYEELTEIGIEILKRNYPILNDVELDVKIVDPDDEEKMEMAEKMLSEMPTPSSLEIPEEENDDVDEDEVNKRKIINNLMQGESQNVHTMMFESKPQVDEINPRLMDLYMRGLEINKKFDWMDRADLEQMINNMPQMVNSMETDYEEENENGESKPKIKARVLDLPMLIHEVVKGIYELIAANAIPEDAVTATKVLKKTDTLKDEQEDIKYGPFIAADMRNYLNKKFENVMIKHQPDNIKELIYGKMMLLPTKKFIDTVKGMLLNDKDDTDTFDTLKKIVNEVVDELDKFTKGPSKVSYQDVEDYDLDDDNELIDFMRKPSQKPKEEPKVQEPKKELTDKDYVNMSQGTLNNLLNKAMEDGDMETAKRIGKFLK